MDQIETGNPTKDECNLAMLSHLGAGIYPARPDTDAYPVCRESDFLHTRRGCRIKVKTVSLSACNTVGAIKTAQYKTS